ncbi:hypothetical protein BDZ88DRAFT_339760 [Geranomyces variabilis]|nr:hypothetical protein BDZ88DRAFT_339760 [Geranomyces variabilis]
MEPVARPGQSESFRTSKVCTHQLLWQGRRVYKYELDVEWTDYWSKKASDAKRKRLGRDWIGLGGDEALAEAYASAKKQKCPTDTPIKSHAQPPVLPRSDAEVSSNSDPSDDECEQDVVPDGLQPSIAELNAVKSENRLVVCEGADLHKLMQKIQKSILSEKLPKPVGDAMRNPHYFL